MDGEDLVEGVRRWRYYCWRCEQWCYDRGPWCQLYAQAPFTDPCYFDEHPADAGHGHPAWPPYDDPS